MVANSSVLVDTAVTMARMTHSANQMTLFFFFMASLNFGPSKKQRKAVTHPAPPFTQTYCNSSHGMRSTNKQQYPGVHLVSR